MPVQPPPVVPAHPNTPETIVNYLNRLSLWMYQELQQGVRKDEATAHLVLAAYDVKNNPNIFRIEVTNSGTLQANAMPLGTGKP